VSDTKISALPAASAALGTMETAVNAGGASQKLTVAQIQTLIAAGVLTPASVAAVGAVTGLIRHMVAIPFVWTGALNGTGTNITVLADFTAGVSYTTPPWGGSIVGIAVRGVSARTAGTLNATPTVGLSATQQAAPLAQLDGTNTTTKGTSVALGTTTFAAGQSLGVALVTSGWTPTADTFSAILYVMYDGMAS
jgi:hypothetical protein